MNLSILQLSIQIHIKCEWVDLPPFRVLDFFFFGKIVKGKGINCSEKEEPTVSVFMEAFFSSYLWMNQTISNVLPFGSEENTKNLTMKASFSRNLVTQV